MFKNFGKFDTHLYARCLNNEFRKRETLKLYREVLKFAHMFTWQGLKKIFVIQKR